MLQPFLLSSILQQAEGHSWSGQSCFLSIEMIALTRQELHIFFDVKRNTDSQEKSRQQYELVASFKFLRIPEYNLCWQLIGCWCWRTMRSCSWIHVVALLHTIRADLLCIQAICIRCRLTAVFTPAVSKLLGQSVSSREWTACSIALIGGVLISLDSALASDSSAKDAALGELHNTLFCKQFPCVNP